MSRTADRQISFADLELTLQGMRMEPLLQAISDFLDDQEEMIDQVRRDLERGLKNPETGRGGLILQISGWSPERTKRSQPKRRR